MFFLATILVISMINTTYQISLPMQPYQAKHSIEDPIYNTIDVTKRKTTLTPNIVAHNANYPLSSNTQAAIVKVIQYAPLKGLIEPITEQDQALNQAIVLKPTLTPSYDYITDKIPTTTWKLLRRKNLEPDLSTDLNRKCYNPGQNVKVLASVSRSPGHNAVYRNFPEVVPRDKAFKLDKENEGVTMPDPSVPDLLKATFMEDSSKLWLKNINYMRPYAVYKKSTTSASLDPGIHIELDHEKVDEALSLDSSKYKRQPLQHGKVHKMLHLNIARVYSPGQIYPKAPAFLASYSLNLDNGVDLSPSYYISQMPVPLKLTKNNNID